MVCELRERDEQPVWQLVWFSTVIARAPVHAPRPGHTRGRGCSILKERKEREGGRERERERERKRERGLFKKIKEFSIRVVVTS